VWRESLYKHQKRIETFRKRSHKRERCAELERCEEKCADATAYEGNSEGCDASRDQLRESSVHSLVLVGEVTCDDVFNCGEWNTSENAI
jgi:hypothetical protein